MDIAAVVVASVKKKNVASAAGSVAVVNIGANLAAVTAVVVTSAVDVTAVDLLLIL